MNARPPLIPTPEQAAVVRSWVIHEDAHILAFAKPSGLVSQGRPSDTPSLNDLLTVFSRSNGKRPELVHRLDRDTSGVILAARTRPAAGYLGKAIQARRVKKTYLALIERAPDAREGVIDAALLRVEVGRESHMRVVEAETEGAQAALSRYRTLAATDMGALVELSPHTGRMHQLRAHMAHIGRPLAGDVRYGGALTLAGAPAPRLMLHAWRLEFPHPEDGRRMRLEAPPPQDFSDLAQTVGLTLPEPRQPN